MRTKAVWAALLVAVSHFAVAQNAGTLVLLCHISKAATLISAARAQSHPIDEAVAEAMPQRRY
jgi:hypothetical protein